MISSRMLRVKIITMVVLLFLLPFASAQELQEQIEVELVQVDVVATDSKGAVVTDLTADDFILKENGAVQAITHFYNAANDASRVPLTVSFLIDTSYSMHELVAGMTRIEIAVQAADLVIDQMKENDEIELIEFNQKPEAIVPFTSDIDSIREKFETLDFQKENTAMHDAVLYALSRINGRSGRKIIVIFSDGMDSASKSVEEDVVEALRKSDATIIPFYSEFARLNFPASRGLGGNPNSPNRVRIRAGEDILRQYAEMSGGDFFSFRKEPELLAAMERFRMMIGSQYTLAYTPAKTKQTS
ncbi:MAG TPA: VWA domain-containing protein, partial [Candidatus Hodarchaeales archaeon]|nr:VWA domain-containing protein [Candidatus Hodarchaeales archaeon]